MKVLVDCYTFAKTQKLFLNIEEIVFLYHNPHLWDTFAINLSYKL